MDKGLERAALAVALPSLNVRAVRESERPDFIVLVDERVHVGVEVTELWASSTEARLERIDGYIQELMDGGVRNVEDARVIRVIKDAAFEKDDGTRLLVGPGVLTQIPTLQAHLDLVAAAIETKAQKHAGYARGTHGHELVIIDRIYWGRVPRGPVPCSILMTPRLRAALRAAPFHDVTVLAVADDERQFRISLRRLYVAERFAVAVEKLDRLGAIGSFRGLDRLSLLAILAFADHSPYLAMGLTHDPEAIHLGRFSLTASDSLAFRISDGYGRPPGVVVPRWPSTALKFDRARVLASVRDVAPKAPPVLVAFEDITSKLRDSVLLRRLPSQR